MSSSYLCSCTTQLSREVLEKELKKIITLNTRVKMKSPGHPLYRRPQIGDAVCGLFGIADEFSQGQLSLDELLIQDQDATFYFKATGDSMSPFIEEGDILISDASLTPKSGQIIIAYYEGQRLCKRLRYLGAKASLHSENTSYPPLSISEESEFQVFGVVTGIIRCTLS